MTNATTATAYINKKIIPLFPRSCRRKAIPFNIKIANNYHCNALLQMICYTFPQEMNVFLLKLGKKCYGFTTCWTEHRSNNNHDPEMQHQAWNRSAQYPIKEKEQTK
ncbi:hypothetical protein ACO0K9_08785 [Undibacterium sp. Ji50W]|uniref:hypothetical protein n=1 Tax=Undibacterium sp. Ji50W TaxID=3413041 RepID=UPI003BEF5D2C